MTKHGGILETDSIAWWSLSHFLVSWLLLPLCPSGGHAGWFTVITMVLLITTGLKKLKMAALTTALSGLASWCQHMLLEEAANPHHFFGFHHTLFLYGIFVAAFHELEFVCICVARRHQPASHHHFILDFSNNPEYFVVLVGVVVEFIFFSAAFPNFKRSVCQWTWILGAVVAVAGDIFRKTAIIQAGSSFRHMIPHKAIHYPRLVTSGVYAYCRHPSYVGWTMFALGTQLMIGNIISFPLSVIIIRNFYRERIPYEEQLLLLHYGAEYKAYMKCVPSGLQCLTRLDHEKEIR